jgi:putative drug exporter of the RND superfamily
MSFRSYGNFVCWAWPVLLLGWVVVLGVTWWFAPPWDKYAVDPDISFLPPDALSVRAGAVFAQAFPGDHSSSNIVLVLYRDGGQADHLDRALKFIDDVVEPSLRQIADAEGGLADQPRPSDEPLFGDDTAKPAAPKERSIIARIHTPNAPGSGVLLISPDRQALLVAMELTTDYSARRNWPTIAKVEELVERLRHDDRTPVGLHITLTGSAVLGRDHAQAEARGARNTEMLTVILVIALLVLIYRVPLLAIVPLLTVVVSVRIALSVLTMLAAARYVQLFSGLEIFVTILSYGAGVDYCLFLSARYREELDRSGDPCDAVARAIGNVGAAVVASAATVIGGIAMMAFARFGKFHQAGIAIPITLTLTLAATLSLSPSLLRMAGRWIFWPQRLGVALSENRATPAPTPHGRFFLGGLLRTLWDDVGHLLHRRAATALLVTAAFMAPFAILAGLWHNWLSYDPIGNLPSDAPSVAGTRALQQHFPEGILGIVTVLIVDPQIDFATETGRALVGRLTDQLHAQSDDLGLADVRSLTEPLGITPAARDAFAGSTIPPDVRLDAARRLALENYTTAMGERKRIGTRLDLVLSHSPFSARSMADLDRIDDAIRAVLPRSAQLYTIGTPASVRDLAQVIETDRTRIERLVLFSVLVILVVLLRGLIVPLYLLASVLFSYFATLGVTFALWWLLDPHGFNGIDWKVAIFLFTILIAVGADYNIFLMTRVHEEQERHGPVDGVTVALTRTGPIISSCGLIMAGTFASLLSGTLTEMRQLGFALAFGVLLDTFVVRPILVPAFLILLSSGRLNPARWMRTGASREAAGR